MKDKDHELLAFLKKAEPSADASSPLLSEVVNRLKEKERALSIKVVNLEKELSQRQNSSDYYKRKLTETKRLQSEIQAKLDSTLSSLEDVKI